MTVIQTGSIALLSFLVGDYVATLLGDGEPSAHISAVIAAGVVIGLTLINVAGLRQSGGLQYALTALEPSPEFHRIAEACGGYGERVDDPAEVPRALQRALKEVRGGRHALLNVVCAL